MYNFQDKPCAQAPLKSYRYIARIGVVMIGAMSDEEALDEAARSIAPAKPEIGYLQVWDANLKHYTACKA